MGLFGSKKTYVSSTVYNMAGDETKRPDYLKTIVVGSTLGDSSGDIAKSLSSAYLNGPGIKQRSYYSWAQSSGYNAAIGLDATGLGGSIHLNAATVAANVPRDPGQVVLLQKCQISPADFEFWAEQWLCDHEPATLSTAWTADHDNNSDVITITRADDSTVSFAPANYGKTGLYVLAAYNLATPGASDPPAPGIVTSGPSFPSTSGWSLASSSTLHHTELGGWDETHAVYSKTEYLGDVGGGRLVNRTSTMYQDQLAHDDGTGHAVFDRSWHVDTQDTTLLNFSTPKVFIYRIGWGNVALDAMVGPADDDNSFFPPIAVRINNQFVSGSYLPDDYAWAKRAYQKLTSKKLDALIDTLSDNPDLGDIDYVFAVPGVALNVIENASRQYIYNFLRHCMLTTAVSEADYELWQAHQADADTAAAVWQAWYDAQGTPGDPLYGTAEPPRYTYTNRPTNMVRLACKPALGFDMRLYWQLITESTGAGLAKPDAKIGEVWFVKGAVQNYTQTVWGGVATSALPTTDAVETITLFWQVDATSWKKLTIEGLKHFNFVYNGKSVEISAFEALDDADESGFMIPLHHGVWRDMSLVTTTQMATASLFLVINSYKIVKKKWYQTGIFKIIVFIAIVAISIYTANPEIAAGYASLGAAAAGLVGITLGVMAATILGAAISALASMILLKLLTMATSAVVGDKWGALLAAVVMFVGGAAYEGGFDMHQAVALMTKPDNLIRLSESVGSSVSRAIVYDAQQVLGKIQDLESSYQDKSKEISDLYAQNIGYGNGIIDPMQLTDFTVPEPVLESRDAFLTRTLMTGSDISDLSIGLISRFTELTLSTKLPL